MHIRDIFRNAKPTFDEMYEKAIEARVLEIVNSVQTKVFAEDTGHDGAVTVSGASSKFLELKRHRSAVVTYTKEKAVTYATNTSFKVNNSKRSPYQYDRIDKFFGKESYLSRAVHRQAETMLRNGFDFVSDNSKLAAQVKRELSLICSSSGSSMYAMIYRMAIDLLKYGVYFGRKVKGRPSSEALSNFKRVLPISPHNVVMHYDNAGSLIGISGVTGLIAAFRSVFGKQAYLGMAQIPVKELVTGVIYDAGDDIFPEPPPFQVLDDVLTLRSFEESSELLVFQFGSPILHVIVGTKDEPARPGEVETINAAVARMAANGMFTTDHRISAKMINVQTGSIDLIPYIEYYKNRVLSGLGSSSLSMGEAATSNRNTSESIDDALADRCVIVQQAIAAMFSNYIIPDVLTSLGVEKDKMYDRDGNLAVELAFNEIRIEKKIAKDNHTVALWQANLINHDEARRALQKTPSSSSDWTKMYVNTVQIPLRNSASDDAVSNLVGSQNTPTNQHTTKAAPGTKKN